MLTRILIFILFLLMLPACSSNPKTQTEVPALLSVSPSPYDQSTPTRGTPLDALASSKQRHEMLAGVSHWLYLLDFDPEDDIIQKISASSYDMVVIEPLVTQADLTDFPVSDMVNRFHAAPHSKLVIAYIDIGQAETWRSYWQDGWKVDEPGWLLASDPDGWEGDYQVAYWREEWRSIWLSAGGILDALLDAGFDGIYLDWVEAYSDESVIDAAEIEGVDARAEMVRWVSDLASRARYRKPQTVIISQNAAELAVDEQYITVIDAIAQEHTWFDGVPGNNPAGDCPLPSKEAEVTSLAYVNSLSRQCRRSYRKFPEGTLHTSSESYLYYLTNAQDQGKIIFTIDYALDPVNINWIYSASRGYGFIPFVSDRTLSLYYEPYP